MITYLQVRGFLTMFAVGSWPVRIAKPVAVVAGGELLKFYPADLLGGLEE